MEIFLIEKLRQQDCAIYLAHPAFRPLKWYWTPEIAKKLGVLTVAIVTIPFTMEGQMRYENAMMGLEALESLGFNKHGSPNCSATISYSPLIMLLIALILF